MNLVDSNTQDGKNTKRHLPSLLLGFIVLIIFLFAIFSFQVGPTENAIVTTFGRITSVKDAGLHFRWPYPVQSIIRFDNRLRCFEGSIGKIEETYTADSKNLIIGLYVVYKIADPAKLYRSVGTISNGEDKLNNLMRNFKNAVVGTYKFSEFVNTDPAKMKLSEIENKILEGIKPKALGDYGLEVRDVGIKSLMIPETTSSEVFERMKAERGVVASTYRAEGEKIAKQITDEADNKKKEKIAEAEAEAKKIRAEGDAKAAAFYSVFKEDPSLADFLRKLDTLKKVMPKKTTLILSTKYPPFDLLNMDPETLKNPELKKEEK